VPSLQVMATPGKLRAVYRTVVERCAAAGSQARAHISRFDADGAVVFFTITAGGDPDDDDEAVKLAERAAESAGAWLLGARATKLDPYLAALRDALDPDRIMNPGMLA
jgi:FAD/FMN-containing dehydrogenase